jgi:hypothetical protein
VKYNNYNTSVDSHDLSNHFSATFVKIIFDSFKNNLDDLLATSEATCHCHSGTFDPATGHCDPPETCEACYAQSDIEALRTWSDDRIEGWFEDVSPLSESPAIVCKTFDDFVASMKLILIEYNALPVMVKHCLENQFLNCVAEVETCLR